MMCARHMFADDPSGEYLVDAWSMVEESRLAYIRNNQHKVETADDGEDGDDGDDDDDRDNNGSGEYSDADADDPAKDIHLPSSFMHSPAWSAAHIADSLALRRAKGNITFFTTLTANPKWPEIVSELLPGQNASDRPDVVCRVFKNRLTKLRDEMDKVFGKTRYSIRVIEFQKRGLPHVHMADALTHVPHSAAELDKVLSARVPAAHGPLRDAVLAHMLHSHRPGAYHRCGWSASGKKCKYGYPKPLRDESVFTEDGKHALSSHMFAHIEHLSGTFEPARLTEQDRWVVLHCPIILVAWSAHANTEYGGSWSLPVYLFKYFYKGPDSTGFKVAPSDLASATISGSSAQNSRKPVDEIKNYERGRYLSCMEATWRIAGFGVTRKTPAVTRLMIHTEGKQRKQMERIHAPSSDATILMRYFDRPDDPRLRNMTYVEFGERCRFVKHDPRKPMGCFDILERLIPGRPQQRIRLRAQGDVVARIVMVYAHHGDVYYLRAILMHKAANSFEDARTVNHVIYLTFQEAAVAMGLFSDNNEGTVAFLELLSLGVTPSRLR
jgi:hypothetical protein